MMWFKKHTKKLDVEFTIGNQDMVLGCYNRREGKAIVFVDAVYKDTVRSWIPFEYHVIGVINHETLHYVLENYVGIETNTPSSEVVIDLVAYYNIIDYYPRPRLWAWLLFSLSTNPDLRTDRLARKLYKLLYS